MRSLFRRRSSPKTADAPAAGAGSAAGEPYRVHQVVLPEPSDFNARRVAERRQLNRRTRQWLLVFGGLGLALILAVMRRAAQGEESPLAALAAVMAQVDLGPLHDVTAGWRADLALRYGPLPATPTVHPMPESGYAVPLGTPAGFLAAAGRRAGTAAPGSSRAAVAAAGAITQVTTTAGGTASAPAGAVAGGPLQVSGLTRPLLPGQPRQLTTGGCCTKAWWGPDSTALEYVDRPFGAPGPAVYRVALWPPASEPEVMDLELAERSVGTRFTVRLDGEVSVVRDMDSGQEWRVATGGNPLKLSDDGSWVVWWDAPGGRAHFDTQVKIRASHLDGSGARELVGLWAGEVIGFRDEHSVIVSGRLAKESVDYAVWTVDVLAGQASLLASGAWLSGVAMSPDHRWLAYTVSLDRADPAANGVWAVSTTPGAGALKLPFEGAYRWRDTSRLVYVPFEPEVAGFSLWQMDLSAGTQERLFDPAQVHLRIAGNDWSISPDGSSLAFLAAEDHNLWVVDLP